jgi:hypothetical protein
MNDRLPFGAPPVLPDPVRLLPDYRNGSIVNLMASLIEGLGGVALGYAPLASLPPSEISGYRRVVLIVVDGLGDDFLSRHGRGLHVARRRRDRLTSVFPSTTAAAITTFLTGLAPQQHGLTGWHMYFRELGAVLAVLPGVPRCGGAPLRQAGQDAARLFGHRPVFDLLAVASEVVVPIQIAKSDFNQTHLGQAGCVGFATLQEFFQAIARAMTAGPERRFVYAYWSELDRIAHESGIDGPKAAQHVREWDQAFGQFLGWAAGTDSLIIITADHGFIDTDAAHTLEVEEYQQLAECLSAPLCGEPRAAYCYVRPGRVQLFERHVQTSLAHAAELYRSADLIAQGWFGLGPPHPELTSRIGDYTLIMKENYVIRDWLPGERRYRQTGVHGGLSAAEMRVPLAVFSC